MVWNSERSPLYQSVKSHNEAVCADSSGSEPREEKRCSEPRSEEPRSKKQRSEESHSNEQYSKEPKRVPKPRGIDRDMLLILMVIFILQSEKADEGLILALLFAMLM